MVEPTAELGRTIVKQLPNDEDMVESIKKACIEHGIRYGVILSTVGTLRHLTFETVAPSGKTRAGTVFGSRFIIPGPMQIVSLEGVIYEIETGELTVHIHGSFADIQGKVYGGDVVEGENPVATRVVAVIAEISAVKLIERLDDKSGHRILHPEAV